MTNISTAAREEEACSKALLLEVSASDSARNRRFPSASQAVQPEDAALVSAISPVVYLLEEADTGVGKAGRVVLSLVRVERRVLGIGKGVDQI